MTGIIQVPLHIGDFLAGTIHMDATETGAYLMLLLSHYQSGEKGLPDDDKKLSRMARTTMKTWNRIRPVLEEKFIVKNDFWVHERVLETLRKVNEKNSQQKAKVLKRYNSDPTAVEPQYYQPKPKPNNNIPPNPPQKKSGEMGEGDFHSENFGGQAQNLTTPGNPVYHHPNPSEAPVPSSRDGGPRTGKARAGSSKEILQDLRARTQETEPNSYKIQDFLSEKGLSAARVKAPGWDVYYLMQVYNEGIDSGKRERPRLPDKAFPAWCQAYTQTEKPVTAKQKSSGLQPQAVPKKSSLELQDWHKRAKKAFEPAIFETWIAPLKLVNDHLEAPSKWHFDYVKTHYEQELSNLLSLPFITFQERNS